MHAKETRKLHQSLGGVASGKATSSGEVLENWMAPWQQWMWSANSIPSDVEHWALDLGP